MSFSRILRQPSPDLRSVSSLSSRTTTTTTTTHHPPPPPPSRRSFITQAGLFKGIFSNKGNNNTSTQFENNSKSNSTAPPAIDLSSKVPGINLGKRFSSQSKLDYVEVSYLTGRTRKVTQHFPNSLGIDDFLHRLEIALYAYGFKSENSIAMVNLCRDEITLTLKNKIDQIFGASFSTNGLGGVLTCGVTGVSAGLSHAPISKGSGKERYVFFSFPHISIDSRGTIGDISRPGRPGSSCACGALNKALVEIKNDGVVANCKIPGVHEPLDPEFTILKQRLARRLQYEGKGDDAAKGLDLVTITQVAERTITDDLEYLISKTVDPSKADYAVVTGVQIHNWGEKFDGDAPNLEWLSANNVYVVVNGEKTYLDLNSMPSFTPRQVRLLSGSRSTGDGMGDSHDADVVCNAGGPAGSVVREIDPPFLFTSRESRRRIKERGQIYTQLFDKEEIQPEAHCAWPSWQSNLRARQTQRHESDNSATFENDLASATDDEAEEMMNKLQVRYTGNGSWPPPPIVRGKEDRDEESD